MSLTVATTVPAFDVPAGTVLHSTPNHCGHVTEVLSRLECGPWSGDPKATVVLEIGCACGVQATFTMRSEHVLTLVGTVALI